jgi:outer membrane protein assembly factor BamB
MRVCEIAATICWGVVAGVSLLLPQAAAPAAPPSPTVPDPAFALGWHVALAQVSAPAQMTATTAAVIVADATSGIHAFAATDGRPLWSRPYTTSGPIAAAGQIVVLYADGAVRVLDAGTGVDRWAAPVDPPAQGVSIDSERIVAVTGTVLRAWRHDGSVLWQQHVTAPAAAPIAIDGARLFVALEDSTLLAANTSDGLTRWQIPVPALPRALLARGGHVYFGASNGTFYSYDQESPRDPDWAFVFRAETIGAPAFDERCVFATLIDNTVRAMHRSRGNLCWATLQLNRRPGAGPVRSGDRLAIVTVTGEVVGVGLRTGRELAAAAVVPGGTAEQPARLLASTASADGTQIFTLTIASDAPPTLAVFRAPAGAAAGSGQNR